MVGHYRSEIDINISGRTSLINVSNGIDDGVITKSDLITNHGSICWVRFGLKMCLSVGALVDKCKR